MSGRAQPLPPLQGGMLVIATIGISVVTAMTVLDSTIANVALPTIAGNLGVASSQGTWVITFFGVANAIAIPLTGWLARRMSTRTRRSSGSRSFSSRRSCRGYSGKGCSRTRPRST